MKKKKTKSKDDSTIVERKINHVSVCVSENVESNEKNAFERITILPRAMPELAWDNLETSTFFLNHKFSYPIAIAGMTGGFPEGGEINRILGGVAERWGIPMGVGSQRIALLDPKAIKSFSIKKYHPKVFLIGNLGASQLKGHDPFEIAKKLVEMIEADALAIHINVLQECLQPEGDRDFRGWFKNLEKLFENPLGVPILIKEVGSGIDLQTAERLRRMGVHGIDIGGKGGTSWGYIEGIRSGKKHLGEIFRNWGLDTATALRALRQREPHWSIMATGGIRNGLTIAKACGLGADMVGLGLPFLKAAYEGGDEACETLMKDLVEALKISMIASGSSNLNSLKEKILWN